MSPHTAPGGPQLSTTSVGSTPSGQQVRQFRRRACHLAVPQQGGYQLLSWAVHLPVRPSRVRHQDGLVAGARRISPVEDAGRRGEVRRCLGLGPLRPAPAHRLAPRPARPLLLRPPSPAGRTPHVVAVGGRHTQLAHHSGYRYAKQRSPVVRRCTPPRVPLEPARAGGRARAGVFPTTPRIWGN